MLSPRKIVQGFQKRLKDLTFTQLIGCSLNFIRLLVILSFLEHNDLYFFDI
jgi:hypothetical protein